MRQRLARVLHLRKALRALRRDEDGAVMVEFLIVLPVLLLLCFGAIELVFVFMTYGSMLDAARDATRQLALGNITTVQAETLAADRLFLDRPFTITAADPAPSGARDVSVTIELPLSDATATSFLPLPARPLSATITMRREE